ncbi:hypothetical protein DB30_00556 [Enhygromyxa salina]|uniref:Uncharacterized protein n=1 Tax=Enhygromyxa salina TaxID=215803 RepID=A0A0C2CPF2_9BACT|nr:hypothetical protein [Enhygromyxa salina]KIG13091.1 hypothetical protein DB30_00556 [Enhygromyxa salina]
MVWLACLLCMAIPLRANVLGAEDAPLVTSEQDAGEEPKDTAERVASEDDDDLPLERKIVAAVAKTPAHKFSMSDPPLGLGHDRPPFRPPRAAHT